MASTSHRIYRARESYRDGETDRRSTLSNQRITGPAVCLHRAPSNAPCIYTGSEELECALSLSARLKIEHTVVDKCYFLSIWNFSFCLVTWSPTKRPYNSSLRPDIFSNSSASCTPFGPIFVSLLRHLHTHLISC